MSELSGFYAANEATWPAAARHRIGAFAIREGKGGGSRVSSATAEPGWSEADVPKAEAAMATLGQPLLFMIRQGDAALDAVLAARGYQIADKTLLYATAVADLKPPPDPMAAFPHWPPLAIADTIWANAGIGPERRTVMDRAPDPRVAVLGRSRDRPSGVAFVAIAQGVAVLHALVVAEYLRRQGTGGNILRGAGVWASEQGVNHLVLAVTATNTPARALYASLGMEAVGQYHYRVK